MKNLSVIFYLNHKNLYSYNHLISAIENNNIDEIFDLYFISNTSELVKKIINLSSICKVVVVCFSFCTPQVFEINNILTEINKVKKENVILIAGGPHPTGMPFDTLNIGFDIVVLSEGEDSLCKILSSIANNTSFENITNIAYKSSNGIITITRYKEYVNINNYFSQSEKYKMFGPIEITRGCSIKCSFCQTSYMFGTKLRHRNIDNILRQVEILIRHNIYDIRFISPSIFAYGSSNGKDINFKTIEELFSKIHNLIKEKGRMFIGTFPSEVRPEHVNDDTLLLIKKYGSNNNIIIGAQTGSEKLLHLYNRHHTVSDIIKAVKLTTKYNLLPNVDFIFGFPNETDEDIDLTLNLIEELINIGARIHAHYFIPLPQTPLWGKKPTPINKKVLNKLYKLSSNSLLYGQWQNQIKIASEIFYKFSFNNNE
ncbi:MAG: TIGR04013 family B12-binding domain/radical SAM domain-containing protein [Bacteroidales bacterium]|nr:TIGR04013 family B12-binding domain/radical SAM domain-containing protein [Bacteroidales bacterium]